MCPFLGGAASAVTPGALEREVLRSAEEERRRTGQDLHDGLGQQLTGIGRIARGLARRLDAEGSAAAEARNFVPAGAPDAPHDSQTV